MLQKNFQNQGENANSLMSWSVIKEADRQANNWMENALGWEKNKTKKGSFYLAISFLLCFLCLKYQ